MFRISTHTGTGGAQGAQSNNAAANDRIVNGVRESWRMELEEDAQRRAPSFEQMTWYNERRDNFITERPEKPKPRMPSPPARVTLSRRPSFSSEDSTATDVEALSDVEVPDFSGLGFEAGVTEKKTAETKPVYFKVVFENEAPIEVPKMVDETSRPEGILSQSEDDVSMDSDLEALRGTADKEVESEIEIPPVKTEAEKIQAVSGPPRGDTFFRAITDGDVDSEEEVKNGIVDKEVESEGDVSPERRPPRGDTFRSITDKNIDSEEEIDDGNVDV